MVHKMDQFYYTDNWNDPYSIQYLSIQSVLSCCWACRLVAGCNIMERSFTDNAEYSSSGDICKWDNRIYIIRTSVHRFDYEEQQDIQT